jgi:dGTPase
MLAGAGYRATCFIVESCLAYVRRVGFHVSAAPVGQPMSSTLQSVYEDPWWRARPWDESPQPHDDRRSPFDRDRDRILHSGALRHLAGKTQVIASPWADRFRTRLTHTLEVAQIGRTVARRVGLDEGLVEAACLAHDLGHPPFGHAGELHLNRLMKDFGGFDANAQTLRILASLERKSSGTAGLNLTRATYWSILKYPYERQGTSGGDAPRADLQHAELRAQAAGVVAMSKFLYEVDLQGPVAGTRTLAQWLGERSDFPFGPQARLHGPTERTLPCQLMDWCDDIAYAIHDFEDAVLAGFITVGSLHRIREILAERVARDVEPHFDSEGERTAAIQYHLAEVERILTSAERAEDPERLLRPETRRMFGSLVDGTALTLPADVDPMTFGARVEVDRSQRTLVSLLKHLGFELLIRDERVIRYLRKGTRMLERTFDELLENPKVVDERSDQLLPRALAQPLEGEDEDVRARVICDFLSSMTESVLTRFYQTVFESTGGSPLY